jgi:hypothetical protein
MEVVRRIPFEFGNPPFIEFTVVVVIIFLTVIPLFLFTPQLLRPLFESCDPHMY